MNPLSSSIALALGAIGITPVVAQTNDAEEAGMMEEVMVTGIRRSLLDSAAIKRDSDGVVDAISAEDIGKFPDTNLAEALSRVTGVSIDRNSPGGPAGEGQRITVRGIGPDYNLVLLNGRQMPATTVQDTAPSNSRAFDFSNLASEAVSGVDVYKTSMSNIPTGGIGATVNIRTARPLDIGERNLSLGAKAVTDTSAQSSSWTPEVSGIYSDVFADGKFGITLTGIYQEREFGYNQASTSNGWRFTPGDCTTCWGQIPQPGDPGSENIVNRPGPDDLYGVPQNLRYSLNDVQRERTNGQLVLQWRPVENLTATLDYTYSELEIQTQRSETSTWFNFGPSESAWTDGPVAAPITYKEFYDGYPSDIIADGAKFGVNTELDSIGLNVEWDVRDGLGFALDMHSSTSESGRASPYGTNAVLSGVGFQRGTTGVDFSQDFPVVSIEVPNGQLDPSVMLTGGASFRNSYMKAEVEQLDLSGYFDLNDTMSLDFGVTATEVNNRSAYANVQYDNWGGIGSADQYPDDIWHVRDIRSAFDNIPGSGNPDLFNQMFVWDFDQMIPIAEAARGQSLRASDVFDTDRRTKEETTSAYLQYHWNFDIGSMNSNFRAGVRYEDTDVTSSALVPIATSVRWVGTNEYSVQFGAPDFTTLDGSYDYWLPNFDFNIEVAEDMIVRASYSKTIGRPGWGDIQGGQTLAGLIRIDGGTGQQGDPGLKPLESQNYDFSFEWYYGEGSYFSVGYFLKDVKNYVGVSTIEDTPFSLPHPAQGAWYGEANAATGGDDDLVAIRQYIFETYGDSPYVQIDGVDASGNFTGYIEGQPGDAITVFDITVPSNQQDAEIDGWEIALQHIFGESGFGVIANYTMVDSDLSYNNASLNDQFAIEGLSDSYNLVAFYDKNGWIARLAYNWRDEFLSTRNFEGPNPLYVDEYAQLDALVSYTFNNGVTLFAEGFNLTDEYLRVHGRADLMTNFVTQTGPRYGLGVRWVY
jgi:TonB-dependent receptor